MMRGKADGHGSCSHFFCMMVGGDLQQVRPPYNNSLNLYQHSENKAPKMASKPWAIQQTRPDSLWSRGCLFEGFAEYLFSLSEDEMWYKGLLRREKWVNEIVCVCVCVYGMCVCVCVCVRIHACRRDNILYRHTHTDIQAHTHTNAHPQTQTHTHTR